MSLADSVFSALQWYLALSFIGTLSYPLLFRITRNLWDHGVSIHRSVGMAAVVLPLWILGNLITIPFTPWTITFAVILVGVPSWLSEIRTPTVVPFLRVRWRIVVAFEVGTAALFFSYVVFRGFNPDISGTEKPMELAFLNAAITQGQLPIPDPWFAGEPINYYTFGYVALAMMSTVTGIPGEVAFNLGLATAFSLATVAAAGLASNISAALNGANRRSIVFAALLAAFFVAAAGNLYAFVQLVREPSGTLAESWWSGTGWASSRVIEDTGFQNDASRTVITEFPAFSWILGDLHPHVIAYPWLIATFALVFNLYRTLGSRPNVAVEVINATSVGLAIGVLCGANTWDVPIVLALTSIALLLLARTIPTRRVVTAAVAVVSGFLILAIPFLLRYDSPTSSSDTTTILGFGNFLDLMGYVTWNRTSLSELVVHWGALIILTVMALVFLLLSERPIYIKELVAAGTISGALVVLGDFLNSPAVALFGVLATAFGFIVARRNSADVLTFVSASLALAFVFLVVIEFFFVIDPFGDRMNTVFKITFQVWPLLAISLSGLLSKAFTSVQVTRFPAFLMAMWGLLILVILSTTVYAPLSAYRWSGDFERWRGIDGLNYIARNQPNELAALRWIQSTDEEIGTLLEAPGCAYGMDSFVPHNRVSMATGAPTVIGWDGHEYQWRRGQPDVVPQIQERISHVAQMYEQPEQSERLFHQYNVTHVYVGVHELEGYRQCGHGPPYRIPDHEDLVRLGWELAHAEGENRIYRVPDKARQN
jgi:YYY domain-containing protein